MGEPSREVTEVRVVMGRYPGGVERVDVVDVYAGLVTVLSPNPEEAVTLAHHLYQVAAWVVPAGPVRSHGPNRRGGMSAVRQRRSTPGSAGSAAPPPP